MKKINILQYNTLIWFIIRACYLELTLTNMINIVKEDSWISALLGSIFGLIPFFIFENIKNRKPDESFISLTKKLYKSNVINTILLIGCLIISAGTFWILVHFSNSLFLYKTSLWIIGLTLIIPIGYTVSKNIHVIAKVSEILFFISVIINIIIMFGLTGGIDINNLKPILQTSPNNIIFSSFILTITNISKLFFLTIIPKKMIKNYTTKKTLLFYIITCINLIDITISIICIFGINIALLYEYPAFQILKRVSLLGVIDRLESILSVEALFSLFIEMIIIIYFIKQITLNTFKIKKTNRYVIPSICLITYILSNIFFKNHESGETFLSTHMLYITLIICIVIPLITLFKLIKKSKIVKK